VKTALVAVWLVLPCTSPAVHDRDINTTTVYSCPNTFGEADGPFVAEGRGSPAAQAAPTKPTVKKKKSVKKKKKRKKRR
jgi:hypothetical protein